MGAVVPHCAIEQPPQPANEASTHALQECSPALARPSQCLPSNSTCLDQPYGQYCVQCRNGTCMNCVAGRSLGSDGYCSLNCQVSGGALVRHTIVRMVCWRL